MSDADAEVGTDAPEGSGSRGAGDDGESVSPEPEDGAAEAPDAFQALGDETRLSILRALHDHEGPPPAFSALREAVGVDVSSRFAYHLRQLTGRYVRKVPRDGDDTTPGGVGSGGTTKRGSAGGPKRGADGVGERDSDGTDASQGGRPPEPEGYALTDAGRTVARAVAAGTYTESVDLDPIDLDDPCPHCGEADLVARCADNVLGVACEACGRPVLSLPFPPPGYRDRDPEAIPGAFDRHHRHRLALLRGGVCPECSGVVEGRIEPPSARGGRSPGVDDVEAGRGEPGAGSRPAGDGDGDEEGEEGPDGPVRAAFECTACGYAIRTPVTLTLLTHPAVVAFYEDHSRDVRDRPVWNVGEEWREAVISADPLAVAVSTELDGEVLELFVDGRGRVVDHRRVDDE